MNNTLTPIPRVSYRGGAGISFPPPEILKFSMVFGQLVCVIEILSRIAILEDLKIKIFLPP